MTITGKFDQLMETYKNATDTEGRRIRVKLREIAACYEECTVEEQEFLYDVVDKFCELVDLIHDREDSRCNAMCGQYGADAYLPMVQCDLPQTPFCQDGNSILLNFHNHFIKRKSPSTMQDYVARVRTFAYSKNYLPSMLRSGELGIRELTMDPVVFTYQNIEQILARFQTKDENGVSIKQRNNIRSALRLLNDFKREIDHRG